MSQNLKQKFSKERSMFIFLQFTKELIRHSGKGEISELQNLLDKRFEEKDKQRTEEKKLIKIVERIRNSEDELIKSFEFKPTTSSQKSRQIRRGHLPSLRIPKTRLPPRFQYLRPTPSKIEVDLGKLDPLAKDPLVKIIECQGASKNIIVEGTMGRKRTQITLDRKEIDNVIDNFSKAAKIPVSEGVFKVAVGKFTFSAIISEIIGSKFLIKKIIYNPGFR